MHVSQFTTRTDFETIREGVAVSYTIGPSRHTLGREEAKNITLH
jgi:cold shock CspA family protein